MYTLGNILIGFFSAVVGLFSLLAFALAGAAMSMIHLPAELAGLVSILPFILMGISALGIWSLCVGSHAGKLAFTFIMLMFWYVGTLLGALILFCLLVGERPQPAAPKTALLQE